MRPNHIGQAPVTRVARHCRTVAQREIAGGQHRRAVVFRRRVPVMGPPSLPAFSTPMRTCSAVAELLCSVLSVEHHHNQRGLNSSNRCGGLCLPRLHAWRGEQTQQRRPPRTTEGRARINAAARAEHETPKFASSKCAQVFLGCAGLAVTVQTDGTCGQVVYVTWASGLCRDPGHGDDQQHRRPEIPTVPDFCRHDVPWGQAACWRTSSSKKKLNFRCRTTCCW